MGFFDTLFGNGDEDNTSDPINWRSIHSEEQLDNILMASNQKPQVIYKHSTRCATSFFALRNLKTLTEKEAEEADYYLIDVIGQPAVSNFVANNLGIGHESPQLLILKDGEVRWHGSHHQVKAEVIQTHL